MKKYDTSATDSAVERLAELLELPRPAAMGLRSQLWELAIDVLKSKDLTNVSTAQWALSFSLPKDAIPELLEAFTEAGLLVREGERILLANWDEASSDERHAAFRHYLRSKPGALSRLSAALARADAPNE